jgi:4-amino-4-deoxy-L-arabinose transferase-like glycosyltransferase
MTFTCDARTERTILVATLLLAAALRVIAAKVIPDQSPLLHDVLDYRESAGHFLKTWMLVSWYEMPLYPLLVALTGAGIGQIVADIALSVISVWLIYALADRLFADQRARILSALIAACYPPLIFFSVVGLSETLFIALVLAAFLCWYSGRFTAAATFAVLAILTRPIFDIFAPVLVLLFALVVHRLPWSTTLRHLGIYIVVYCALMTPWWINNYRAYGGFVRLTLGAGQVLYAGNNPLNRSGGGILDVDYDLSAFANIANPIDRDRALRDAALDYIVHHPQRFFELAGLKFLRIWWPWPVNDAYRSIGVIIVSVASFVPVLLLAAVGLLTSRRRLRPLSPILVFALGYTAVLMILVGTIRYRLALEPFLIVFAGSGATFFIKKNRIKASGCARPPAKMY